MAVSTTSTRPSNLSMGRLSGLRPASIRASRDIRPVATRGTVSDPEDGMAKLLRAHRDVAVGLIDVPPGSGAARAGGASAAERQEPGWLSIIKYLSSPNGPDVTFQAQFFPGGDGPRWLRN